LHHRRANRDSNPYANCDANADVVERHAESSPECCSKPYTQTHRGVTSRVVFVPHSKTNPGSFARRGFPRRSSSARKYITPMRFFLRFLRVLQAL